MEQRSVQEIKREIEDKFIESQTIREKYQLEVGKTFGEQFSTVSLENIIFYVVSFSIWVLEKMFFTHKSEIDTELNNRLPHTKRWYQQKVLQFQYPNRALITDTDKYENTGLSTDKIEELQVVKFCAVHEKNTTIYIKVAKGAIGNRAMLAPDEETALRAYIIEVKDAGVLFEIVNQQADKFRCKMIVYYNPMLLNPANKPAENAIKNYITTLNFNGEYRNATLVDELQAVPGIVIPHLEIAETKRALNDWEICEIRTVPESGYFTVDDKDLNIEYIPYEYLQS